MAAAAARAGSSVTSALAPAASTTGRGRRDLARGRRRPRSRTLLGPGAPLLEPRPEPQMKTVVGAGVVLPRQHDVYMVQVHRRGMTRWELPSAITRLGETPQDTAFRC